VKSKDRAKAIMKDADDKTAQKWAVFVVSEAEAGNHDLFTLRELKRKDG
jgi:hypothetical protein